ncbi:MAG: hypothetical protein KBD78_02765 [Oligoflexales bacterium]|nr:hypothetical protein [Oligoflexales bacterium]
MALLVKCSTPYAISLNFFRDERGIIRVLDTDTQPPGLRFVVAPFEAINLQILKRVSEKHGCDPKSLIINQKYFFEIGAGENASTVYLVELSDFKEPEKKPLAYAEMLKLLPQTHLRKVYMKALQVLCGTDQETIRVLDGQASANLLSETIEHKE